MNILIKGAGITGMILCDVLKTEHPNWNITVEGYITVPNDYPLFLDLSQINFEPSSLAHLPKRKVKVGYTKNNLRTIMSEPTEEMLQMYYKKQGRVKTSSSMSNSNTQYDAIDLKDWYDYASNKWSELVKRTVKGEFDIVFETKATFDLLDAKRESEYIVVKQNNLKGFDYVYDCSDNDIKRYNEKCIEYTQQVPNAMKISNYYGTPRVVTQFDTATNCETIYISRNATKSQLKIVDALNYINYRWGGKNED